MQAVVGNTKLSVCWRWVLRGRGKQMPGVRSWRAVVNPRDSRFRL